MERLLEFIGGALPQEIDPFVAFSTLIIALFSWGDHMLHPDLRESIKSKVFGSGASSAKAPSTPKIFNQIFEDAFSSKHWTLVCFKRSALVSVVALTVVFLYRLLTLHTSHFGWSDQAHSIKGWLREISFAGGGALGVMLAVYLMNILTDFASLYQTRLVLRIMDDKNSIALRYVFLDALLTFLLYVLLGYTFAKITVAYLVPGIGELNYYSPLDFSVFLIDGLFNTSISDWYGKHASPPLGAYEYAKANYLNMDDSDYVLYYASFATTFLTSIWLWITAISIPLVRAVYASKNSIITRARSLLDTDKKPLQAIGVVFALLFFMFGVLVTLIGKMVELIHDVWVV
ncbi:MAG: hypothetical protein CMI63_18870 [Parvularcula sp.]|nr:hypothetical protein [Parvularcula sp.]